MNANLDGKRVAILVADGFEQVEMTHRVARWKTPGRDGPGRAGH